MASRKSDPTPATRLRLAHVSGNRCAFPSCTTALIDPVTGGAVGRIAHIRGAMPGSARYDPNQTDEQRRAFANLVYMCGTHAALVDDPQARSAFPVDLMVRMKADHESRAAPIPDDLAKLIAAVSAPTVIDQSVTNTGNLSGRAQVAHTITNIGQQPRQISAAHANAIAAAIRPFAPILVELHAMAGDADSFNLAEQLRRILPAGGWTVSGDQVTHLMADSYPNGVRIEGPERLEQPIVALGSALIAAGIQGRGRQNETTEEIRVIVAPYREPER